MNRLADPVPVIPFVCRLDDRAHAPGTNHGDSADCNGVGTPDDAVERCELRSEYGQGSFLSEICRTWGLYR